MLRRPKRIGIVMRLTALSLAALVVAGVRTANGQAQERPEYEVKAIFLRLCTRHVVWPSQAFPEAGSPFVVGVLGKDPFGGMLEKAFAGKTVSDHKVVIRRYRRVEEINSCHLLFISQSEKGKLVQIFDRLGKASTLTVGDTANFLQRGGMINFWIENKLPRFEVDLEAAERAGLKISSDMLGQAKYVRRGGGG